MERRARGRWLAATATAMMMLSATAPAQEIAPGDGGMLPFDESLLRLSEILGAVHYLRRLCDSDDGSLWRDQMQALLESEQTDENRHARFVDRFNRGHNSFRAVYRTCTPAAKLAIDRYLQEGANIARDITARYGTDE